MVSGIVVYVRILRSFVLTANSVKPWKCCGSPEFSICWFKWSYSAMISVFIYLFIYYNFFMFRNVPCSRFKTGTRPLRIRHFLTLHCLVWRTGVECLKGRRFLTWRRHGSCNAIWQSPQRGVLFGVFGDIFRSWTTFFPAQSLLKLFEKMVCSVRH